MTSPVRLFALTLLLGTTVSVVAGAQTPPAGPAAGGQAGRAGGAAPAAAPAPAPRTVALTTVWHSVTDLEKSVAFYSRSFGLPALNPPGRSVPNAAMGKLTGLATARFRQSTIALPGTGLVLRLSEYTGVEKAPKPGKITDPGQVFLRFEVEDMDTVAANLQRNGARFITADGAAATAPRAGSKATFYVQDPDGFVIEIVPGVGSVASNVGVDASPVLKIHVVMTVSALDKKLALYKDILGFEVKAADWKKVGTGTAESRANVTPAIGGTGRDLEFLEYRNLAGTPAAVRPRLQDPPASGVSVIVTDLAAMLKSAQAAGLRVLTAEATPVVLGSAGQSLPRVIIEDSDGVFVELAQS